MQKPISKYETEIRLSLLSIVVLLILLNISSNYILQHVKRQLTEQIDRQLTTALHLGSQYLINNGVTEIPPDQTEFIRNRSEIDDIFILALDEVRGYDTSSKEINSHQIPPLNISSLEPLQNGQKLFRFSQPDGKRMGLTLVQLEFNKKYVIIACESSWVLNAIISASEKALYIAIGVVILIIPLTIFLPRFILRPFRTMREKARSAGKLDTGRSGDEVDEVIGSYERIIDELRNNEAELKRLYRDTSDKADRLERFNLYILKSIKSGVITVDLTGKVICFNRAAGEILDYSEEEVINRHYLVAFPREERLGLLIEAGLQRTEGTGYREVELHQDDDIRLWLGVETSLIYDDRQHPVGVNLLFTDLTELKKLESELEVNRRMAALGEMTSGLAHQLRNSLAAVSGFCQLMKKKVDKDSALGEIADSIKSEAAKSEIMVQRFLDFARPLYINPVAIDMSEFVKDLIKKYKYKTAQVNVQLTYRCQAETVDVIADVLLLEEAISNVIDNSLTAVGQEGSIDICLTDDGGNIILSIADTGPGIDDKIMDKIFTPFYSSQASGTGLGLSLSRKIINLHSGRIFFETGLRSGAVCHIILPLSHQAEKVATSETVATLKKE
jgi:PAS domain S-box-containing protein